jgi:alanine dehydrogenase
MADSCSKAKRLSCWTILLILKPAEVASLFSYRDAMDAVEQALRAQAVQAAHFPLRVMVATAQGLLAAMPGAIEGGTPALGAKLVSVFPENARHGLESHQALIALFTPDTGEPLALLDGRIITEIRTAAVSALATKTLAPAGASVAGILGTGVQARAHARALAEVMTLDDLRIWGRRREHAEALCKTLRDDGIPARAVDSAQAACGGAAVICTVTASAEPVVPIAAISGGVHINAVGACTPHKREIPADLMALSSIVVDSIEGARNEAGDIVMAIDEGALPSQPRLTLLADIIAGHAAGRSTPDEITLFESLGIAIEDVACAALVYERARARGIGTTVGM